MGDKLVIRTLREQLNQAAILLMQISSTLAQLEDLDDGIETPTKSQASNDKPVMLTINDCLKRVDGLTEYTLRQHIRQKKIPYVRAGAGNNGKILISEKDLLEHFSCR